ncbi:MAG: hypothetical protein QW607_09720 [Desulfurococcaceae archaeon]
MNKKLIFLTFLFVISLAIASVPSNIDWTKLRYSFVISLYGTSPFYPSVLSSNTWYSASSLNPFFAFLVVNNITAFDFGFSTSNYKTVILPAGVYVILPVVSSSDVTAGIYKLNGEIIAYTTQSGTSFTFYYRANRTFTFAGIGSTHWSTIATLAQDVFRTVNCQSQSWTLIVFNISGNTFYQYQVKHSQDPSSTYTLFTYAGGAPAVGFLYAYNKNWMQIIGPSTHNLTIGCLYIINDNVVIRANETLTQSPNNQTQPINNQTLVYYTLNVTTVPHDYAIAFYYNGVQDANGIGTLSKQYVNGSRVEYRIYRQGQLVYSNTVVMTRDYTFVHNFGSQLPSGNYTLTLYFYEYSPESGTVRGSIPVDKVVVRDSQNRVVRTAENVAQAVFSLNAGVYSVTITKQGFYDTFMQVTLDQDRTFHVYLVRAGEYYGNTKPPAVISPEELTNETAKETHDTLYNATNIPAPPPPEDNWYGFHIIVLDPQTRQLSDKPTPVTIYLLKGINRVLWQDQIEIPIRNIEVRGQAYVALGLTEIKETLRKQAWESFNGFKIVSGDNVMFVPESSARQRYFEIIIYEGGNIMLGVTDTKYSGPFSNFDWTNILTLLPLLIVLILIIKLLDVL